VLPYIPTPLQPDEPDDDYVLTVADDYLKNGGKIPKDADLRLLMRFNLATTRTTFKQSHRNHRNIMAQWLAMGGLLMAGAANYAMTATAHAAIWNAIQVLQKMTHTP
jgi:hypothetical protein